MVFERLDVPSRPIHSLEMSAPETITPSTHKKTFLSGPHRITTAWVIIFIVTGVAYRLYLTSILPVGYDEVKVMAVGLEEMTESVGKALIEVPVRRSNGITPLWWWLEYALTGGGRAISLLTLRIAPVVLGVLILLVGYRVCSTCWGRSTAVVFTAWLALSDVLTFTNSRSDFSESLSVLLLIPIVCLIGRPGAVVVRGLCLLGLLMTGFGKGIFAVGLMVLAESVVLMVRRFSMPKCALMIDMPRELTPTSPGPVRSLIISLVIAVVPTGVYLLTVALYFAPTGSIHHDAVEAEGLFDLLYQITLNYPETKAHVTGGPLDAALIWMNFDAWPVQMLSVPVIAIAILFTVRKWWAGRIGGQSCRNTAMFGLMVWALCGAVVVISRGTAGARFHLMYLPALWLFAAHALRSRLDRVPTAVIGSVILGVWIVSVFLAGPVIWASFARFEPMYATAELKQLQSWRENGDPKPPPHGRTLNIDLAHHYLTIDPRSELDLDRAIRYSRQETRHLPDVARGWFYLGDALHARGASVDAACAAWRRGLTLHAHAAVERKVLEQCSGEVHSRTRDRAG